MSDTKFAHNGVRQYQGTQNTWTIVAYGKVSVAMNADWTARCRTGGAQIYHTGGPDSKENRTLGVRIPRSGWKRGFFFVAVYAPTSCKNKEERTKFRKHVSTMIEKVRSDERVIIAGDMNAEMAGRESERNDGITGPYSNGKLSETGKELLAWCREEGMIVASTFFQQKCKATWWHPGYGSGHELDHMLIKQRDRHDLVQCRVLHFENKECARRRKKRRGNMALEEKGGIQGTIQA